MIEPNHIYKINTPIEVRYVAKNNVSGITDLAFVVTSPAQVDSVAINMTEIQPGVYRAYFTPNSVGYWWVRVYSATKPENDTTNDFFVSVNYGYLEITLMTNSSTILIDGGILKSNLSVDSLVTIDGRDISVDGTNLDLHIANTSNPHSVTKTQVNLNNVDNVQQLPMSYLDTDVNLAADSNTKVPSQHAAKTYIDGIIAAANALVYKGAIDCSGNPNYPAADAGWIYVVRVAGKIGGVSGIVVDVGDLLFCKVDGSVSGDQVTVGANWNIIEKNIVAAVSGPATAVDTDVAVFDGTTGKLIKDSGVLLYDLSKAISQSHLHANITALNAVSGTNTGDETTSRIGTLINGSNSKTTPVDADLIAIADSALSFVLSKLTWANLKATLKIYFDGIYSSNFKVVNAVAISTVLDSTYFVVTTTGTITVTLPTAVGITGREYTIKKMDAGTTLTVNTTSSQTIDGSTSLTIKQQYYSIQLISNGANWIII